MVWSADVMGRAGRVVAVALVSAAVAGCASEISFPNFTPDAPVHIRGALVRPAGAGPHPAVVLLHGCHGVAAQTHRWARWLAERGYVALIVDSFGPRNITPDCLPAIEDELPVTARLDDALGALRYLQAKPFVIGDRVAAIGWSQGGVFAMSAINGQSLERAARRGVTIPEPGYAAAIGLYPGGCPALTDEVVVRPLLILIGANDDWTPPEFCVAMAKAMRERGAEVSVVVYPDAVHYFDVEGQPRAFLQEVESLYKPGGGATVGYQAEAAADAHRQVEVFLARHLGRRDR
jgi:dienelactone hydrolase